MAPFGRLHLGIAGGGGMRSRDLGFHLVPSVTLAVCAREVQQGHRQDRQPQSPGGLDTTSRDGEQDVQLMASPVDT